MEILIGIFGLVLIAGLVYFAPSIVALVRRRRDHAYIFALNVFLGWTFIGWVVALLWALRKQNPVISLKEEERGSRR